MVAASDKASKARFRNRSVGSLTGLLRRSTIRRFLEAINVERPDGANWEPVLDLLATRSPFTEHLHLVKGEFGGLRVDDEVLQAASRPTALVIVL